ncbi:TonB-dependent receptor [Thalassotalea nanhaiensis]|uniref:TonB-dependent receptor n=1 Tax=Thalassotalea nanhaiensis TaxID=3065648 RepID=A0ABY9TLT4_9GAMM|nr:TonB-dependent receptor [Colwelliaceae bacterium SQ345]
MKLFQKHNNKNVQVKGVAKISIVLALLYTLAGNASEVDTTIERITISNSRSAQVLNEVPRAIELIDTEDIERVQVDHIQQVLNQEAGVFLNRNSGQEMLLAIRSPVLTGAGACGSFLTLENGIALRPNGFCNVNELFESHYEMAQRIEIIKGPTSVYYGSNGLHGAINIIQPASLTRSPFIKATFGEWDYKQLSFLANSDNVAISSSLSHDGGYRDDSGFDQQKVSLTHLYQADEFDLETFITATNLNQETAGYIVGKDSYKDEEIRKSNPNPEAYRDASAIRLSQRYSFSNGLVISPFARYSEMEFLQHFIPGKPVEKNKHHSFGLQSQYQIKLMDNTIINLGLDAEYAEIALVEEQFSPTEGSAFLQATIPVGKHYDYEVEATTLASFVSLQHPLSSQWQIDTGIRLESITFDYQNKMNTGRVDEQGNTCGFGGCRFNRPENSKDEFTIASPKLGLIYNNESYSGYVNVSHGFRAPQATELYRLQREQMTSELEAEELIALDGGWQTSFSGAQLNLSAYKYEKSNVILRDNDYFYVSDGETEHTGIELSLDAPLLDSINLKSNISYSKHQYKNNPNLSDQNIIDNDIANAPRWLANIFASYQHTQWQFELHGQFVGKYYLNAENTSKYSGHTLVHARAKYEYLTDLSFFFNLENLLDTDYAERANYTSFTQERYFPGMPRNIKFSVYYSF